MAGGVERMASALMNEMTARGHTVSLMSLDHLDAISFYPLDKNISWHKINVGNPARKATIGEMIKRALRVRSIVREVDPDIIIGFQDGPYLSTRVYTLGMSYPIILAERNAPSRYHFIKSGKHRHFIFQTYRFAKRITIQCESYRNDYPAYLHSKIVTIPNPVFPVDPLLIHPKPSKGRKILLSVGRLEFQKNYSVLLHAFAQIAAKAPEWDLRIIGEGSERKTLENLARDLGIENRIQMPGTKTQLAEEYTQASLFCLPSRWEGFPNSLAEALSYGVPAVGFATCAGVNDLIQHKKNGILAQGNENPTSLAQAFETLLNDPQTLQNMGKFAFESVKVYKPEHIYDLWETFFEEAIRP